MEVFTNPELRLASSRLAMARDLPFEQLEHTVYQIREMNKTLSLQYHDLELSTLEYMIKSSEVEDILEDFETVYYSRKFELSEVEARRYRIMLAKAKLNQLGLIKRTMLKEMRDELSRD